MKAAFSEKIFSALAYIFGVPALYVVLTRNRKKRYLGYHGARALKLWFAFFVIFFGLRLLVNMIWSVNYVAQLESLEIVVVIAMAGYALFCGFRSLGGYHD